MKQRKQMRVYDLYRLAMVGKATKIRGIHQYWCNDDVTRVCITFENIHAQWIFQCGDEQDHKNLIRCVNRMLHSISVDDYAMAFAEYNKEYRRRWADEV